MAELRSSVEINRCLYLYGLANNVADLRLLQMESTVCDPLVTMSAPFSHPGNVSKAMRSDVIVWVSTIRAKHIHNVAIW